MNQVLRASRAAYVIGIGLICAFIATAGAEVYRWVDDQGKIHYSQSLPAEAAHTEHSTMNKQGAIMQNMPSQREREEERRRAELLELADSLPNELEYDRMIEGMYTDKRSLEVHFTKQINMISTNIRLLEYNRKQLKNKLLKLKEKLVKAKSENDQEVIRNTIHQAKRSLASHDDAIMVSRNEQNELNQRMKRIASSMGNETKREINKTNKARFNALLKQYCDCSCKK